MDSYPEVKLADLSQIAHSYHIARSDGVGRVTLIVRFIGQYGVGSRGNRDGEYMRAVACAGLEAWLPGRLVFDFREFEYAWGDMLASVLAVGKGRVSVLELIGAGISVKDMQPKDIATAVVVSDKCRDAVNSLLVQEMREDPAKWLFDSLPAAVAGISGL